MSDSRRVVVVSDATHDIGAETVRQFADQGADVHTLAEAADAEAVRSTVGASVRVHEGTAAEPADLARLVEEAITQHGRIDVLVNSQHTEGKEPVADSHLVQLDDWDEIFNVNLRSSFIACQLVLPHMMSQNGGVILQLASTTGLQASALMTANAAASAAAIHLARGLAVEYLRYNIRVNAAVVSGTFHSSSVRIREGYQRRHATEQVTRAPDAGDYVAPPRDLGKIAQALVLACDPKGEYLTGSVIAVDGGLSAGLAISALLENAAIGRWAWPT